MRRSDQPISINLSRHKRLLLWARLYLAWLGEFVAGAFAQFRATRALNAPIRHTLDYIARIILCALFTQAALAARLPRGHARWYGDPPKRTALVRAMIGSQLRRMLRQGDASARIATISALLRDPARVIAELMKRYERGLTKLYRHDIAANAAPALACALIAPCFADSS